METFPQILQCLTNFSCLILFACLWLWPSGMVSFAGSLHFHLSLPFVLCGCSLWGIVFIRICKHFVYAFSICFWNKILFKKRISSLTLKFTSVGTSCIFHWALSLSTWYFKKNHIQQQLFYHYFCVWPKKHRDNLLKVIRSLCWSYFLLVQHNKKLAAPLLTKLIIIHFGFCFTFSSYTVKEILCLLFWQHTRSQET